jgi:histidinol-phosphate aminotransferase
MHFVTDMVAVGDAHDVSSIDGLSRQRIGAVLSLERVDHPPIPVPHVLIEVSDKQALAGNEIMAAVHFVQYHVGAGRRVLVHCRSGISRSPALIACYLHEYEGWSIDEALTRVKIARPQADPHQALVAAIRAHYGRNVAASLAPDGGTGAFIDLSTNENPGGASPLAVRAIIDAAGSTNHYPDSRGAVLKGALAEALGVGLENIVLGNGSSEILEITARAVLDHESEAVTGWPSFPAYRQAVDRAGGKTVLVPLVDHNYDLDAIAERVSGSTRLIILGNPNNPTGQAMGRATLHRFLDRLPPGVVLCLDEAYCDYVRRSDFPNSLEDLAAGRPLVVVRTFSKAYGLAGVRIGYAIASEPLARRIDAQRQRYNTSGIAQAAALAALGDRDHLAKTVALNADGRNWLSSRLSDLGLFFLPSEANFLMIRVGDGAAAAGKLEKMGVRVKSLDMLGLPDFIRVSIGAPDQNARFADALQEALSRGCDGMPR